MISRYKNIRATFPSCLLPRKLTCLKINGWKVKFPSEMRPWELYNFLGATSLTGGICNGHLLISIEIEGEEKECQYW